MLAKSLNPFEFRAGIYLNIVDIERVNVCLNPFEFRAGIYFVFITEDCEHLLS